MDFIGGFAALAIALGAIGAVGVWVASLPKRPTDHVEDEWSNAIK